MTVIDEWVEFEYWDCQYCGTKGIRGDFQSCQNCGKPRDTDVTFYSKVNAEVTRDAQELKKADAGADWCCPSCNNYSSALTVKCPYCGSSRGNRGYFDVQRQKNANIDPPQHKIENKKTYFQRESIFVLIAACILILFSCLLYFGFRYKNAEYNISSYSWERTITVGKATLVNKENWKNDVNNPYEIKDTRTKFKRWDHRMIGYHDEPYIDHTRVACGQIESCSNPCSTSCSSQGNGRKKCTKSCTRSCSHTTKYCSKDVIRHRDVPVYKDFPIYDTWVSYTQIDYIEQPPFINKGVTDVLAWPQIPSSIGFNNMPDKELNRSESYKITYLKEDKQENIQVPEATYLELYKRKTIPVKCSWFLGCKRR